MPKQGCVERKSWGRKWPDEPKRLGKTLKVGKKTGQKVPAQKKKRKPRILGKNPHWIRDQLACVQKGGGSTVGVERKDANKCGRQKRWGGNQKKNCRDQGRNKKFGILSGPWGKKVKKRRKNPCKSEKETDRGECSCTMEHTPRRNKKFFSPHHWGGW